MNKTAASYAQQLFVSAREANYLEEAREDLNKILAAIEDQPKFMELLMAPAMKQEDKKELITSTFVTEASKIIVDFLLMLVEENCLEDLEQIGKKYHELVSSYLEDYFGIVEGTVYSVIPISDTQLTQLTYVFTKKIGKKVRLTFKLDESLIGGYKVSIGGKVYDSSIKLQLKQLKERLMTADLE